MNLVFAVLSALVGIPTTAFAADTPTSITQQQQSTTGQQHLWVQQSFVTTGSPVPQSAGAAYSEHNGNISVINQSGSGNDAETTQQGGSGNNATINQSGWGNLSVITQTGSNHSAESNQTGGAGIVIHQSGEPGSVVVHQNGH